MTSADIAPAIELDEVLLKNKRKRRSPQMETGGRKGIKASSQKAAGGDNQGGQVSEWQP